MSSVQTKFTNVKHNMSPGTSHAKHGFPTKHRLFLIDHIGLCEQNVCLFPMIHSSQKRENISEITVENDDT